MATSLVLPSGRPNPYAQPAQQAAPVNPWGALGDPSQKQAEGRRGSMEQARSGLNYAAQKGWGRKLTADEENNIYGHAKSKGYQDGGEVDTNIYNSSLDYMTQLLGPQAVQKTPEQQSAAQPGNELGNESAMNQWQKQAPAMGVPQSFRGANPYAAQQQSMMQRILANPETMDQKFQDQLGESQKESANRMMSQANASGQQQLAGRGFGGGGGTQQAMQNDNQQNMISQLLSGRRDIATQAAQVNRQDQYNALNQSSQLNQQDWNGQMDLANMGLGQMNQNRQANLQDFLGRHSADEDVLGREQNDSQFNKNFGLDFLRYMAQKDQFKESLGENKRQYNDTSGFNWANFDAQQQQAMMNRIFGY